MLFNEYYKAIGGNYEAVKQHIPIDELIEKFLVDFLTEPSYDTICHALEQKDYKEAFRVVHSLKGLCANLGFTRLEKSASDLTELLRHYDNNEIDIDKVNEQKNVLTIAYNEVIEAIKKYR